MKCSIAGPSRLARAWRTDGPRQLHVRATLNGIRQVSSDTRPVGRRPPGSAQQSSELKGLRCRVMLDIGCQSVNGFRPSRGRVMYARVDGHADVDRWRRDGWLRATRPGRGRARPPVCLHIRRRGRPVRPDVTDSGSSRMIIATAASGRDVRGPTAGHGASNAGPAINATATIPNR